MAVKLNFPSSVKATTWYPQYQETNVTTNLPLGSKQFGMTKRVFGISPNTILGKVSQIKAQYDDVNNGNVPHNRVWETGTTNTVGANEKSVTQDYAGSTIPAGGSLTVDIPVTGITSENGFTQYYKYYIPNSGAIMYVNIGMSVPTTGTLRLVTYNTGSTPLVLPPGKFYAEYYNTPEQIAINFVNYGIRKGTPTFSEFAENGISATDTEKIYAKVYDRLKVVEGDPNLTVNDTELYGDYYQLLYGYGTDVQLLNETRAAQITRMSTQNNARGNSGYYQYEAWKYRHRFVGGYLNGIADQFGGVLPYNTIKNIENAFIAMEDRKVAVFGWGAFEGVDQQIEAGGVNQRLPLPDGDLIRTSRPTGSFGMGLVQAFFSILIGNTYVMWAGNDPYYSTDIQDWDVAYIGGPADFKNQWQPYGGVKVQYNPNTAGHPYRRGCTHGCWSDSAEPVHNGAFVGSWYYDQIKNRTTTLKYATFGYTINGASTTGYASGNTPVLGSKGDASVSRFGNGNPGQHNIVNQWFDKKPIVMEGNGSDGRCLIILNVFANPRKTYTYTITTATGVQTITHNGDELGIYTF